MSALQLKKRCHLVAFVYLSMFLIIDWMVFFWNFSFTDQIAYASDTSSFKLHRPWAIASNDYKHAYLFKLIMSEELLHLMDSFVSSHATVIIMIQR